MTAPFLLESLRSLAVTGPDAFGFLQNQLSSDLHEVSESSGQLSAWHDPKGRVLVFLRVLPWQDGYLLVMHAGLAATVQQRLGMYVLRAKVTLRAGPPVYGLAPGHAPEWLAAHGLARTDEPLGAACSATAAVLRMPGRAGWLVAGELGADVGPRDPAAAAAWELAELEAGIPEVYPETSGKFVAQMLNLDLIGAISFNKGCYPGQEIVARAHHLGRVKRRARLFRAHGAPPAPGETLSDSGGAVVRATADGDQCVLMAVVAEDLAGPLALADGRALQHLPA
jgi:tRNA-modifying protein YgfZ